MLQLHNLKDQTVGLTASWHWGGAATAGGVALPDLKGCMDTELCISGTQHRLKHSSTIQEG